MKFYSRFDVWLMNTVNFLFVFGFGVAVFALFAAPQPYNLILYGFYIFLVVIRILGLKPRHNGHITDSLGNPLGFAIVKVYAQGIEQEITKRIADKYGRYFALVPQGDYYVKIEKKNNDETYTHVYTSETIRAKGGIIFKNFKI